MYWTIAILVSVAISLAMWSRTPARKRRRFPNDVPPEDRDRLGPGLAAWLHQTRALATQLEVLEDHAKTMLAQELERGDFPRNLQRQIQDANFLNEIRRTRDAGEAWIGAADELSDAERRVLADADIEPGALAAALELPWGESREHDKMQDRSAEIRGVLEGTREALAGMHRIDQTLSRPLSRPYR